MIARESTSLASRDNDRCYMERAGIEIADSSVKRPPKRLQRRKLVCWEKTGTVLRLKAGNRVIAYVYQRGPELFEAMNADTGEYRADFSDLEDAKDWAVTSARDYCARVLGSFCAV